MSWLINLESSFSADDGSALKETHQILTEIEVQYKK